MIEGNSVIIGKYLLELEAFLEDDWIRNRTKSCSVEIAVYEEGEKIGLYQNVDGINWDFCECVEAGKEAEDYFLCNLEAGNKFDNFIEENKD